MTCRAARLSQDLLCLDLVFCCECGSADLEVCYTSKSLGPHLCPTCVQSKVEYGTWEDTQTRSPNEGAACRLSQRGCTQVTLTYARQRTQKEDLWSANAAGDCSSAKFSMT